MNRFVIAACTASISILAACNDSSDAGKSKSPVSVQQGNVADCAAFGLLGMKIEEPVTSGTYNNGPLTVTIEVSGNSFSFTSNISLDKVAVKGGPNTAIYTYDPEVTSGSGITTENGAYGLSHVLFCYDNEPDAGVDSGPPMDTGLPDTNQPPPDTSPPCNPEEDPEC